MLICECPLSNVIYESLRWQLWCSKSSREVTKKAVMLSVHLLHQSWKRNMLMSVLTIRYQSVIYAVVLFFVFGKKIESFTNHLWMFTNILHVMWVLCVMPCIEGSIQRSISAITDSWVSQSQWHEKSPRATHTQLSIAITHTLFNTLNHSSR